MLRLSRRCLMTAPSVAVKLPPSKPAEKGAFHVEREPDTSADLGARNEAAYFNYTPFEPTDLKTKYAMPSLNNLLTSVGVEVLFVAFTSIGLGALAWQYLVANKYETVALEYPKEKKN